MYKMALIYPQAMRYISALANRSLLNSTKDERGQDIYHFTDRGRELSGHIDVVINLFGLGKSLNQPSIPNVPLRVEGASLTILTHAATIRTLGGEKRWP